MGQKFDERQLQARRKGYAVGFWTMTVLLFILPIIGVFRGKELFVSQLGMGMTTVGVGIAATVGYWIYKDAYLTIDDSKRLGLNALIIFMMGLIYCFSFFSSNNPSIKNGQITDNPNLALVIMWLGLGICLMIKAIAGGTQVWQAGPRSVWVICGLFVAVFIASIIRNLDKQLDISGMGTNLGLPVLFLLLPSLMNEKYRKSRLLLFLLGILWFGYITLYYLIGFHNYRWQ